MKKIIRKHPLLTVILIAAGLRLIAAIFSGGYMAHDDHFETVRIAWGWHNEGIFESEERLRWDGQPEEGVSRCIAYNLFLLGLMKLHAVVGIEHLDQHMYFNRLIHALLSLLPVIFGYKYLREKTDSNTAMIGGLLLGAHFLMPFLGVRNLIEMVSASLLLPALYYAHRSIRLSSSRHAVIAGILGGLAFAVRIQVGFCLIVVPIAMVIQQRRWREAIVFSVSMLFMLIPQGLLDIYSSGKFLNSVLAVLNSPIEATVPGPWYRYILLLFGIMIPPFSLVFISGIFQPKVIKKHLLLWLPFVTFLAAHSIIANKQERFIIPIFPILLVLGCVGLYYLYKTHGWYFRWQKLRILLWLWFILVNSIALVVFTFNYAHRGAIEPLVYLSCQTDCESVLFDCSDRQMFVPYSYWNYRRPAAITIQHPKTVRDALVEGVLSLENPPEYVVLFSDRVPADYLSDLRQNLGEYQLVYHGNPSLVDKIANRINPKYNRRNESWVMKLAR